MFEKTTVGEWVVLGLSVITAIIVSLSRPLEVASSFGVTFIVSLIILYIIYWIITKVYPKSQNWGVILWIVALVGIPIIIIFVLAFVAGFISGLTVNQHTAEINQAMSYIHSADSRLAFLSSVDYKTVWVGQIKANASAAKSDLTEASNILNNIPLSDLKSQDQTDLQAVKVMINVDIELCDLLQGSFSDLIENTQTYAQTKNPGIAANSMNGIKISLSNMKSSLGHMVDEMNSVNENDLSPKFRSDFISLKSMIQSLQETTSKTSNTLENECTVKCYSGSVVGTDCQCHPACGANYCSGNAHCCNGHCYTSCSSGLIMGSDCICHASCGGMICSGVCCGGKCWQPCSSGLIMGSDCICHASCGNNYCSSDAVCCGGQCYTQCPAGSVMGNDCICHR